MRVRPASCRWTCRDLHAHWASLMFLENLQQRANTGGIPPLKCQGWGHYPVFPGVVHDTSFPCFHVEQPNTPALKRQDVVVGKSYMGEGFL